MQHARISCRFLPMVLALWYSRAGSRPVLEWCHLSHRQLIRGESNLKRSNRLVLLVGVFLAIVAFVGVILLRQGRRRPTAATPARRPSGPTVVATADIPLGDARHAPTRSRPRRSPSTPRSRRRLRRRLAGRSARSPASRSRPAARSRSTTLDCRQPARSSTSTSRPASARSRSRSTSHRRRHRHQDRRLRRPDHRPERRRSSRSSRILRRRLGHRRRGPQRHERQARSSRACRSSARCSRRRPRPPRAPQRPAGAPAAPGTALDTSQQEIVILAVTPQQAEVIMFAQLDGQSAATCADPALARDFIDPVTGSRSRRRRRDDRRHPQDPRRHLRRPAARSIGRPAGAADAPADR